jgi:glucuronoarabinoxylan endo-1,4-beta-xylanase
MAEVGLLPCSHRLAGLQGGAPTLPKEAFSEAQKGVPLKITKAPSSLIIALLAAVELSSCGGSSSTPNANPAPSNPVPSIPVAIITWTHTYQTIDGFGASIASESAPLTGAEADLFFSPANGVGLSLLRTRVPDDGSCKSANSTCAGEVNAMQLAIARGAKVWSTPWSPPASMKSNGSTICNTGSGSSGLNSGSYGAYATYLSNYITSLSTLYSIDLYAISVQNEPNYCPTTYAGAIWSDVNFDDFIKNNLGPTLAANGQSGVRVMMPESANWSGLTSEADACMNDSTCAQYVGINAWHDYDDAVSITNPYSSTGKGLWETEVSGFPGTGPSLCGGCWDPSMADALLWAGIIDNRMAVSNANAWNYWLLINHNNSSDNEGLVVAGVASQRLYVMGNYSKFVRPGWVRMDATHIPVSGVTVSAYKDPVGGNFAVVATNHNGSNVNLTLSLSGFAATSVTPSVTSASLDLAQQPNITGEGSAFSVTLSASSVTTFVGSAGQ